MWGLCKGELVKKKKKGAAEKGPVVVVIRAQHGWVKAVGDCSPASYRDVELKARCLHWVGAF